jgi:hypothetical protein
VLDARQQTARKQEPTFLDAKKMPCLLWIGPLLSLDRSQWRLELARHNRQTEDEQGHRRIVKGPIPDLDRIEWASREVYIVFDANAATNDNVRVARSRLARELARRGARVFFVEIPEMEGGSTASMICCTSTGSSLFMSASRKLFRHLNGLRGQAIR